jgi:hypothetical protein
VSAEDKMNAIGIEVADNREESRAGILARSQAISGEQAHDGILDCLAIE